MVDPGVKLLIEKKCPHLSGFKIRKVVETSLQNSFFPFKIIYIYIFPKSRLCGQTHNVLHCENFQWFLFLVNFNQSHGFTSIYHSTIHHYPWSQNLTTRPVMLCSTATLQLLAHFKKVLVGRVKLFQVQVR